MRRHRHRKNKSAWPFSPQILAPDGRRLYHTRQIPDLPLPRQVVVRDDYLFIDGWFIMLWPLHWPNIHWFGRQAIRWVKMDKRQETKAQICGILEAMENLLHTRSKEAGRL